MTWRPPTVSETLDRGLAEEPARPAVIAPSGSVTYEELDALADAAADVFAQLGVRAGDRVAASLPNDIDIVVAFHGALRLGAIWVGVNRNLAKAEKEALLGVAEPSVFLAETSVADEHRGPWRCMSGGLGDSSSTWADALAACMGGHRRQPPDPNAPAAIAFTSGTTGLPKGIVHSQYNLLLPAAALVESRSYDSSLRKGDCLPLTILNLQVLSTLVTSCAGGCAILTDRRDARGVAAWIARESVNVWNGVPPILFTMVHDPELDPELLGSLREVWTGGAACPEELFAGVEERFGVRLYQSYGLTEAPTAVTIELPHTPHAPGSSGVPLPQLEVVIRDDAGAALPPGGIGEVAVRATTTGPWAGAYKTLLGYWADGVVDAFSGGELPSGDIGEVDGAGRLFIRDRKKLLILRGGANVYPAEVERAIEQVAGVRASAVIGLPDARLGQRVVAVVETEAGVAVEADDVIAHCSEVLARYKIPERVAFVDEFPRNAMGKIQRGGLEQLFETALTSD